MTFLERLYGMLPSSLWLAVAVALAAIVLLFGFNWLAARREDREDVPVRLPPAPTLGGPPDVESRPAVAGPARFAAADHERAVEVHSAGISAVAAAMKPKPRRLNRHKAKVRRKK